MSTPMFIDAEVRERIQNLIVLAMAHPVQMVGLTEQLQIPEVKARHMAQMTAQTIPIPLAFMVTFSIEHGHPCGTCRHMSMSVQREGRVPNEQAVWWVAQEFGFWGSLTRCTIWLEQLRGYGQAVNVLQPVAS